MGGDIRTERDLFWIPFMGWELSTCDIVLVVFMSVGGKPVAVSAHSRLLPGALLCYLVNKSAAVN